MAGPDAPHSPTPYGRSIGRILLALLAVLCAAYAAAVLWLLSQETRLLFQAGRSLGSARPPFPYEQVELARTDGDRQIAWIMRSSPAAAWVLYFHGNSATIASRGNIARYQDLRALGLNIFAPEYRGYAGLPGVPSEPAMAEDARTAFDYLTRALQAPPARVIVYGWSLGSAVAVTLASERSPGAVILEGAPASIVEIGQQNYPLFPVRLIMRNPFESIERIGRVRAPLLFLHSPGDAVIPIGEGRRLFEAAPAPKRFVEVRGGHIFANEVDREVFFGAVRTFLEEAGLLAKEDELAGVEEAAR